MLIWIAKFLGGFGISLSGEKIGKLLWVGLIALAVQVTYVKFTQPTHTDQSTTTLQQPQIQTYVQKQEVVVKEKPFYVEIGGSTRTKDTSDMSVGVTFGVKF